MRFCAPLATSGGLFFKVIRVLNEQPITVKSRDSFPRASLRVLWIAKASAENAEFNEVIRENFFVANCAYTYFIPRYGGVSV